MSKSLLIIGCGFIGKYFLNHFADSFDEITTTSTRSIPHTKSKTHISFNMYDSNIPHFPKSDIALITLPFSRQLRTPTDYTNAIETISKRIPQSSKVIFTSSTGIYPFLNTWVDETSATDTTSRARALEKCENNLLSAFKTCHILRLAGICGYERNSHTKLSKKIIY